MNKDCKQCGNNFEITDEDLKFYDKISPVFAGKKFQVPAPNLCPDCRQQRRLAMRNERKLYNRKCDFSGKQIISMHSSDKPYKVYDQEEWWGDKWDGMDAGRDFDFSRTFTEQFIELYNDVPHASLFTNNVENSYYTNFTLDQKNCYLIYGSGGAEDCVYGKFITHCKNCLDNLCIYNCELCYEGVASDGCYNCKYFVNCRNCVDSIMIEDCQACKNCVACFGLRNKEYCVMNKFLGKEKYEELVKEYEYLTPSLINNLRENLKTVSDKLPHIQSHIFASEDCTGNAVFNCKNCDYAFDSRDDEDCKFIYFTPKSHNTYDCSFCSPFGTRFCYDVCSTVDLESSMFCFQIWYGNNIFYSIECNSNCENLFGCAGLKKKKYCIFNKQYTPEEYEKMVAKIIEHMRKTGEWGEYFDFKVSSFGYNETIANEYYPLTKEQALKIGAKWEDAKQEAVYHGESIVPLEDIKDVKDEICDQILKCEVTGKHYKIIPVELQFYRKMKLPIPRICPDQRHVVRLALHNPNKLWNRKCAKCDKEIKSVYAPERPEIIYCEECYLKEVY